LSISNKHAIIDLNPEYSKAFIIDLSSINGTYVNEKRLQPAAR